MQTDKVVRVMREVSIHLRDILIVTLQSPFETVDISGAQPELPLSLLNEKPVGKFLHETFHYVSRAVRAVILNDQYIESHRKIVDISYDFFDILLLVICRDDY